MQSLFFVRIKALVQLVAPRQTYLWSVVVCCANTRACRAIVSGNKFSPHRPSNTAIFDCNNLPSVCSRLLPPFESPPWFIRFVVLGHLSTTKLTHLAREVGFGALVRGVGEHRGRVAILHQLAEVHKHRLRGDAHRLSQPECVRGIEPASPMQNKRVSRQSSDTRFSLLTRNAISASSRRSGSLRRRSCR